MRRLLWLVPLVGLPTAVTAQSSEFGTRGLGLPGRALSVRALGTSGSFALFDSTSSANPASIGAVPALTATFTLLQNFRSSQAPGQSVTGRDTRFPQIGVFGPVGRRPFTVGLTYSTYTDRDFSVATTSDLLLRGVPVTSYDTLTSRGGLNDLRLATAYRGLAGWQFGIGFHIITGSARTDLRRSFSDSGFTPVHQRAEISYVGFGLSGGVIHAIGDHLGIALAARTDGTARVDRDSTRVNRIGLPNTWGAALRWTPSSRLSLAAEGSYRTWSEADAALVAGGGTGAQSTKGFSLGGVYVTDARRPSRRPIRFGVHYAQLPFPLVAGDRPSELGLALGSGIHFTDSRSHRDVASLDLSLEHVWRREAAGYREQAWLLALGVSVRP